MGEEVRNLRDFDEIYGTYFALVYKYTLSFCRDPGLAEEIAQETFFRALKNTDSFRGDAKIETWLCQIAKNIYLKTHEKQRRQAPLEKLSDVHATVSDPLQKASAFELHKVLHNLEEPYKEVFTMRTFGELSFKEIAQLFNKTESWARVTYHRGKIKIQEQVKDNEV